MFQLHVACRLKFADDPKIYRVVNSQEDIYLFICLQWQAQGPWTYKTHTNTKTKKRLKQTIKSLRNDLKNLVKWSVDWQMLFNTDKCKIIHIGHSNCHVWQ